MDSIPSVRKKSLKRILGAFVCIRDPGIVSTPYSSNNRENVSSDHRQIRDLKSSNRSRHSVPFSLHANIEDGTPISSPIATVSEEHSKVSFTRSPKSSKEVKQSNSPSPPIKLSWHLNAEGASPSSVASVTDTNSGIQSYTPTRQSETLPLRITEEVNQSDCPLHLTKLSLPPGAEPGSARTSPGVSEVDVDTKKSTPFAYSITPNAVCNSTHAAFPNVSLLDTTHLPFPIKGLLEPTTPPGTIFTPRLVEEPRETSTAAGENIPTVQNHPLETIAHLDSPLLTTQVFRTSSHPSVEPVAKREMLLEDLTVEMQTPYLVSTQVKKSRASFLIGKDQDPLPDDDDVSFVPSANSFLEQDMQLEDFPEDRVELGNSSLSFDDTEEYESYEKLREMSKLPPHLQAVEDWRTAAALITPEEFPQWEDGATSSHPQHGTLRSSTDYKDYDDLESLYSWDNSPLPKVDATPMFELSWSMLKKLKRGISSPWRSSKLKTEEASELDIEFDFTMKSPQKTPMMHSVTRKSSGKQHTDGNGDQASKFAYPPSPARTEDANLMHLRHLVYEQTPSNLTSKLSERAPMSSTVSIEEKKISFDVPEISNTAPEQIFETFGFDFHAAECGRSPLMKLKLLKEVEEQQVRLPNFDECHTSTSQHFDTASKLNPEETTAVSEIQTCRNSFQNIIGLSTELHEQLQMKDVMSTNVDESISFNPAEKCLVGVQELVGSFDNSTTNSNTSPKELVSKKEISSSASKNDPTTSSSPTDPFDSRDGNTISSPRRSEGKCSIPSFSSTSLSKPVTKMPVRTSSESQLECMLEDPETVRDNSFLDPNEETDNSAPVCVEDSCDSESVSVDVQLCTQRTRKASSMSWEGKVCEEILAADCEPASNEICCSPVEDIQQTEKEIEVVENETFESETQTRSASIPREIVENPSQDCIGLLRAKKSVELESIPRWMAGIGVGFLGVVGFGFSLHRRARRSKHVKDDKNINKFMEFHGMQRHLVSIPMMSSRELSITLQDRVPK